jgi:DNA-binding transcriptional ArsR family regulator
LPEETLEKRLERLERLLLDAVRRLEKLEELLSSMGSEAAVAARLATVFSMPAYAAIEAARRITRLYPRVSDPVSRAVLEALADCEPHSISEVTKRIRELRGTASRRIVRERLSLLASRGIVLVEEHGGRRLYRLASCREGLGREE